MKCNKLISCYFGNKVVFVIVFQLKKKKNKYLLVALFKKKKLVTQYTFKDIL